MCVFNLFCGSDRSAWRWWCGVSVAPPAPPSPQLPHCSELCLLSATDSCLQHLLQSLCLDVRICLRWALDKVWWWMQDNSAPVGGVSPSHLHRACAASCACTGTGSAPSLGVSPALLHGCVCCLRCEGSVAGVMMLRSREVRPVLSALCFQRHGVPDASHVCVWQLCVHPAFLPCVWSCQRAFCSCINSLPVISLEVLMGTEMFCAPTPGATACGEVVLRKVLVCPRLVKGLCAVPAVP